MTEYILIGTFAYILLITFIESIISVNYLSGEARDILWYPSDLKKKNLGSFWCWVIFIFVRIISPAITIIIHGAVFIAFVIYKFLRCFCNKNMKW